MELRTLPRQSYHWHSNKPAAPLLSQVEVFNHVMYEDKWKGPCAYCKFIEIAAHNEDEERDRSASTNTESS
jgi:hypothetical protein